jgi:hypothetical protein
MIMNVEIEKAKLERRAFTAYFRRFGKTAAIPSSSVDWFEVDGHRLICLSNLYGCCAHYRVSEDAKLRYYGDSESCPNWKEIQCVMD